jgi:hypothetical protein
LVSEGENLDEENDFERFMERILQRTPPHHESPVAQVRTLAREIAEGAYYGMWGPSFVEFRPTYQGKNQTRVYDNKGNFISTEITLYLYKRWNGNYPNLELLEINNYIRIRNDGFEIKKSAFDLVRDPEKISAFISYHRPESSALALLVRARLKAAGLGDTFLDMNIPGGDDLEEHIKTEIEKRKDFILLIGKNTLSSIYVLEEIRLARLGTKRIIPIWHNEYEHKTGELGLEAEIDEYISKNNAIRVLEESALGYENAIIQLLNQFGITP